MGLCVTMTELSCLTTNIFRSKKIAEGQVTSSLVRTTSMVVCVRDLGSVCVWYFSATGTVFDGLRAHTPFVIATCFSYFS